MAYILDSAEDFDELSQEVHEEAPTPQAALEWCERNGINPEAFMEATTIVGSNVLAGIMAAGPEGDIDRMVQIIMSLVVECFLMGHVVGMRHAANLTGMPDLNNVLGENPDTLFR